MRKESAKRYGAVDSTIYTQSIVGSMWLSQKAVNYILSPKRGGWNSINPDVCASLTAKGQSNWIGSFVSPDIASVEHDMKQGGTKPTIIHLTNGETWKYDGKTYERIK